jgi:hypothetical protein
MAIQFQETPEEDTQTTVRQQNRERDEMQQHLDARFQAVLEAWQKARKPRAERSPFDRITVAKNDVQALKDMIRRAATLHKHAVVFFQDAKHPNGNVTVKYVPAPKPEPKPKADTAAASDGSQDAAG